MVFDRTYQRISHSTFPLEIENFPFVSTHLCQRRRRRDAYHSSPFPWLKPLQFRPLLVSQIETHQEQGMLQILFRKRWRITDVKGEWRAQSISRSSVEWRHISIVHFKFARISCVSLGAEKIAAQNVCSYCESLWVMFCLKDMIVRARFPSNLLEEEKTFYFYGKIVKKCLTFIAPQLHFRPATTYRYLVICCLSFAL